MTNEKLRMCSLPGNLLSCRPICDYSFVNPGNKGSDYGVSSKKEDTNGTMFIIQICKCGHPIDCHIPDMECCSCDCECYVEDKLSKGDEHGI